MEKPIALWPAAGLHIRSQEADAIQKPSVHAPLKTLADENKATIELNK